MGIVEIYKSEDELCSLFYSSFLSYVSMGMAHYAAVTHNNNGEHSGTKQQRIISGSRAKRMGQTKGWPDYTIAVPDRQTFHIEMKANRMDSSGKIIKGYLTKEQKEVFEYLRLCGQEVYVCYSVGEAIDILTREGVFSRRT
jgi:hypothetical protein